MPLILGIDPGSHKTGFGVIDARAGSLVYVASGVIRLTASDPLPLRLKEIFLSVSEIVEEYQPQEMAIEQVFLAKNPNSALKLGQARGAAIVATGCFNVPVFEYEARKVKQAVVGVGSADKLQVQHMVKTLLKLNACPQEDAADALAVAICHAHNLKMQIHASQSLRFRRGRLV